MLNVCFDMDGTIADFFGVEGWLEMLHNEDTTPYRKAKPLVDLEALSNVLDNENIYVSVISWSAKNGTKKFNDAVRSAKVRWIKKYFPCVDKVHVIKYGTNKQDYADFKNAILIDDNKDVRDSWSGTTIDASDTANLIKNIIKVVTENME